MPGPKPSPGAGSGEAAELPKGFGLATATFVVVSSLVGTGVLTTSGFVVRDTGSNALMIGLWALGGVIALCGALVLAELSAALPRSGGEYVILTEAYGPLAGFLSGWVSYLLGFAAPIAASASAAATYMLSPLGLDAWTSRLATNLLASLAVVALASAHASGHRGTVRVQGLATALTLILMTLFVVAGLKAGLPRRANLIDAPPVGEWRFGVVISSLIYISYAYTGWNGAAYVAGEIASAERSLPRAILLGTGGIIALYLGLNVVYALALPAREVKAIADAATVQARARAPAALSPGAVSRLAAREGSRAIEPIAELAARRHFGAARAAPVAEAIGLLLLASLSALLLTGPRVLHAMARAGQFPAIAGRLSGTRRTPAMATVIMAATALGLLWTGSFESLVVFSGFGLALFSMPLIAAVFVLRQRRPDLHRPFRTPAYPLVPAVYLAATLMLTTASALDPQKRLASVLSLGCILLGVPVYYVVVHPRRG
jgi:APA family basic amino acid/polyamine antiporter